MGRCANSVVLQWWISRGAKMKCLRGPPPRFDHGVLLLGATPLQKVWLDKEINHALGPELGDEPRKGHTSKASTPIVGEAGALPERGEEIFGEIFSIINNVETTIGETNIISEKNILPTDGLGTSNPPVDTEVKKIKKSSYLEQALRLRWTAELGITKHSRFGRPDMGVAMQQEHVSSTEDLSVVLQKEKGRRHHQVKRRLQIPWQGCKGSEES
eukprot:gene26942-biopygen27903